MCQYSSLERKKKENIQFCILEKVGSQIIGETSLVAEAEEQSSNLSCLRCSGGTTGVAYGCNILRLWRAKRLRTTAALKEDMLKVKNSNSQVHLRSVSLHAKNKFENENCRVLQNYLTLQL